MHKPEVPLPADADAALPREWRAWVLENLVLGADDGELTTALVGQGLEQAQAAAAVQALRRSEAFALAAPLAERLAARARRAEAVLKLREALHAARPRRTVPRRAGLTAERFFEDHYVANRPVVLPDVMSGWRAVGRWGPDDFAARFGDVEVDVCVGRDGSKRPDKDYARHVTRMPLGRFAELVARAPRTNDLYLIANNRAMERPELQRLLHDVEFPEHLVDARRLEGAVTLWFGPAGTRTPAHHDVCNILFCQVTGRKRVRLVPPDVSALLDDATGFYAAEGAFDALDAALVCEVELAPGEALFLPVGWWHDVEALDVSVTLSFTRFHAPNAFGWYAPGKDRGPA